VLQLELFPSSLQYCILYGACTATTIQPRGGILHVAMSCTGSTFDSQPWNSCILPPQRCTELCATNRLMIRRVTRSSAVAERAPCIRVRVWGPDQTRTRIRTVQDCYPDSAPAPVGRPSWTGLPWEKIWSPASRKIWHTCVNCGYTHECQIWP